MRASPASTLWRLAPSSPTPVPGLYGQAILASVELSIQGSVNSNTAYVVLQTDVGDGIWYDVAWCSWNGTTGQVNFALCGGAFTCNSFQQRASGTAPAGNNANQISLGGRIRFVGKASVTGSSSSSSSGPGVTPAVLCTIRYKIMGLR